MKYNILLLLLLFIYVNIYISFIDYTIKSPFSSSNNIINYPNVRKLLKSPFSSTLVNTPLDSFDHDTSSKKSKKNYWSIPNVLKSNKQGPSVVKDKSSKDSSSPRSITDFFRSRSNSGITDTESIDSSNHDNIRSRSPSADSHSSDVISGSSTHSGGSIDSSIRDNSLTTKFDTMQKISKFFKSPFEYNKQLPVVTTGGSSNGSNGPKSIDAISSKKKSSKIKGIFKTRSHSDSVDSLEFNPMHEERSSSELSNPDSYGIGESTLSDDATDRSSSRDDSLDGPSTHSDYLDNSSTHSNSLDGSNHSVISSSSNSIKSGKASTKVDLIKKRREKLGKYSYNGENANSIYKIKAVLDMELDAFKVKHGDSIGVEFDKLVKAQISALKELFSHNGKNKSKPENIRVLEIYQYMFQKFVEIADSKSVQYQAKDTYGICLELKNTMNHLKIMSSKSGDLENKYLLMYNVILLIDSIFTTNYNDIMAKEKVIFELEEIFGEVAFRTLSGGDFNKIYSENSESFSLKRDISFNIGIFKKLLQQIRKVESASNVPVPTKMVATLWGRISDSGNSRA